MYEDVTALNMLATATKGFNILQDLVKDSMQVNKGGKQGRIQPMIANPMGGGFMGGGFQMDEDFMMQNQMIDQ